LGKTDSCSASQFGAPLFSSACLHHLLGRCIGRRLSYSCVVIERIAAREGRLRVSFVAESAHGLTPVRADANGVANATFASYAYKTTDRRVVQAAIVDKGGSVTRARHPAPRRCKRTSPWLQEFGKAARSIRLPHGGKAGSTRLKKTSKSMSLPAGRVQFFDGREPDLTGAPALRRGLGEQGGSARAGFAWPHRTKGAARSRS
jgi:hypothetical protein